MIQDLAKQEHFRRSAEDQQTPPAVQILRSEDEIRAVQGEWEEFLAERADDHTVREQPVFMLEHMAYEGKDMKPFVVILRDDDLIVCVAPFYLHRRKIPLYFGPVEIPTGDITFLRLFGERVVHQKGISVATNMSRIFQAIDPHVREFDAIWLPEIPVGGDIWSFFQEAGGKRDGYRLIELNPNWETVQMIDLPGSFDEYLAGFTSRDRGDRKRQLKKLEKGCGGKAALQMFSEPAEVRRFAAIANTIRNNSWKAEEFGRDRFNERFVHFLEMVARKGWLRGYLLNCGDRPIAYTYGYMYGNTFMPQEWSFEEGKRSLSPGMGMVLKMLKHLCELTGGCRVLLQPTDNRMKRSLGNATYEMSHAVVVADTAMRSRVRFGFHRFVALQHQRISRLVKRFRGAAP